MRSTTKTKKCFKWTEKYDVLELAHAHARDNRIYEREMDIKQIYVNPSQATQRAYQLAAAFGSLQCTFQNDVNQLFQYFDSEKIPSTNNNILCFIISKNARNAH